MRRITTMALFALLVGGLAACGDDDNDASLSFQTDAEGNLVPEGDSADDAPDTDPAPSDDSDDGIPPIGEGSGNGEASDGSGGSGAAGTMTVDGLEVGLDEVIRCEEDSSDLDDIERLLEVSYTGGDYFLSLYTSELDNVGVTKSIDVATPDGRFGGGSVETATGWNDGLTGPSETPPYRVDGGRITGSAIVTGSMDPDVEFEVSFDLVFPDETTQCR